MFQSSSVTLREPTKNTPKGGYYNSIAQNDSLRLSSPGKYLVVAEQDVPASATGSITIWADYIVDLHDPTHETEDSATFILPYDICGATGHSGFGPIKSIVPGSNKVTDLRVDTDAKLPEELRENRFHYTRGYWRRVSGPTYVSVYHANSGDGDFGSIKAHSTAAIDGFAVLGVAPPSYPGVWNGSTWAYDQNTGANKGPEANGARMVSAVLGLLIPGRQDAKQYTHFHSPTFMSDPVTEADVALEIVPLFNKGDVFEFVPTTPGDEIETDGSKNASPAHTYGSQKSSSRGIVLQADGSQLSNRLLQASRTRSGTTYRANWIS